MRQRARRLVRWLKPNFTGLVVGVGFFCLAMTPSLLPMPPFFEGLVAGISFAVGYFMGVVASWLWRKLVAREPSPKAKRRWWGVVTIGVPIVVIIYVIWATSWQNDVRALIGLPPLEGYHFITIISTMLVIAFFLMLLGHIVMRLSHKIGSLARRWLPARIGTAIGFAAALTLTVLFLNGVLIGTFMDISRELYKGTNNSTPAGIEKPQNEFRSGSDSSLVSWETLGRRGRMFVGSGPTVQQMAKLNGRMGKQPIRVYAGLYSAPTLEERAELAVRELKRTGAFEREVLAVITATGTGWIESQTADALEYIWNGNTALVSMQYSYLPSWISFLTDPEIAALAGRTLFNAVYEHWEQLPENDRPQLLAYGLSLGAYGAQAAFSGVEDIQNRTNGALFVGSPNFSQPWGYFTEGRDSDSPEWQPVYNQGEAVRFASNTKDLKTTDSDWQRPRIVYLQHASDPVVWWSFDLILNKPDWLKEPRGEDVTPLMQWYPLITFLQVTVNQFFAGTAPAGHGHNYTNSVAGAWASISKPPDWSTTKHTQLQNILDQQVTATREQ